MKLAYQYWRDLEGRIEQISWDDFLARAVKANEEFLNAQDQVRDQAAQLSTEHTEQ